MGCRKKSQSAKCTVNLSMRKQPHYFSIHQTISWEKGERKYGIKTFPQEKKKKGERDIYENVKFVHIANTLHRG